MNYAIGILENQLKCDIATLRHGRGKYHKCFTECQIEMAKELRQAISILKECNKTETQNDS